jgi:hypothetical protein
VLLHGLWSATKAHTLLFQSPALQTVLERDRNVVGKRHSPGSKDSSRAREIANFADRRARGASETDFKSHRVMRDNMIRVPFSAISSARVNARSMADVSLPDT